MKVSIIRPLALAGSLACMAAFQVMPANAAGNQPEPSMQALQSTTTRAEVSFEYLQARKEARLPSDILTHVAKRTLPASSSTARADVSSEYLQAFKEGTLPSNSIGGLGGTMSAKAPPSSLTRQEVHADTIEWLRLNRGDVQMGGQ